MLSFNLLFTLHYRRKNTGQLSETDKGCTASREVLTVAGRDSGQAGGYVGQRDVDVKSLLYGRWHPSSHAGRNWQDIIQELIESL